MNVEIKERFNEVAKSYDENRKKFIPCFDDFYEVAAKITNLATNKNSVLDIGAGTGLLSQEVKKMLPDAEISLIDISEKMLDIAKMRFEGVDKITYRVGDFTECNFDMKFDIIISALAIHHVAHNKKVEFFKKCLEQLNEGGIFVNADQFNESTEYSENISNTIWNKQIKENGITEAEYDAYLQRKKLDKEATVEQDLKWLKMAGFSDVTCFYKYFKFGVVFARKLWG